MLEAVRQVWELWLHATLLYLIHVPRALTASCTPSFPAYHLNAPHLTLSA